MIYRYVIPGPAVAQGRPRITTANGYPRVYDPPKSSEYKKYVRACVMQQGRPKKLLTGALRVDTVEYRRIAASLRKAQRVEAARGTIRPIAKPDMDNVEKAVWDALTGLVWKDDAQVAAEYTTKMYWDVPGIHVVVGTIEEAEV